MHTIRALRERAHVPARGRARHGARAAFRARQGAVATPGRRQLLRQRCGGAQLPDRHADHQPAVRAIHDSARAAESQRHADRAGARIRPHRQDLRDDARRPRRLGARLRAARDPCLHRGSGRPRERAWTVFRIGPTPFVPYPVTQFPVEVMDQYFAQLVPNTDAYLADPATRVNALAALFDKIGPAVVSVHSMSGPQGTGVAIARPNLVKAVVDVEPPSGCVISDADVASVFTHVALLAVFGDHTPGDALWAPAETSCQNAADRIQAAGGIGRNLVLPDIGIFGNSHMMMLEKNNGQIADVIIKWLEANVWEK